LVQIAYAVADVADEVMLRVRSHPGRPAVGDGTVEWSYGRLGRQARLVESHLRALRIGPGDIVLVHGGVEARTVAVLLGVLLSGAAYLATGADTPVDRLTHMVRDAEPALAITHDAVAFRATGIPVATYDLLEREGATPPEAESRMSPDSPAYLVYTSGTTGVPRGAVISRRSLCWHATAVGSRYGLTSDDRVLQTASLAFDVAAEEIWPTLCAGASVQILPGGLGSAGYEGLTGAIRQRAVTVANLPAGYFSGWAAHLEQRHALLPALRLVIAGSEELPMETARRWCSAPHRPRLINAYGVSEATITSLTFEVRPHALSGDRVPIGTPLPGVRAVIVGDDGERVSSGVEGQLVLGGPGIMLGYHGADPRPAARIREMPIDGAGPAPWYLTGDRAREENGLVYFLGRADDQLKINGVRIDPGEIAAVLTAEPSITDARVMTVDGELVACLRTPYGIDDHDELFERMRQVLPEAMVPQAALVFEDFPRTAGGKTDMPALRRAAAAQMAIRNSAPRKADLTTVLRRLWSDILATPEVDTDSDFFALGGDSLRAARLSRALHRETGVVCQLTTIFTYPRFGDCLRQLQLLADVPARNG
jgi:surfactin family lipopeptide synthetase A